MSLIYAILIALGAMPAAPATSAPAGVVQANVGDSGPPPVSAE